MSIMRMREVVLTDGMPKFGTVSLFFARSVTIRDSLRRSLGPDEEHHVGAYRNDSTDATTRSTGRVFMQWTALSQRGR